MKDDRRNIILIDDDLYNKLKKIKSKEEIKWISKIVNMTLEMYFDLDIPNNNPSSKATKPKEQKD